MKRTNLLNFPISIGSYQSFVDAMLNIALEKRFSMICVANVHMFIESHHDAKFNSLVNAAEIIAPDGKPLIWWLKILKNITQERVAGMDLLPDLLKAMQIQNISGYFFGGTEKMLSNAKLYMKDNFPGLRVVGCYSPPFSNDEEPPEENVIEEINSNLPCIVFVILGCPKQEKWMYSVKDKLNTVVVGIGGAFPVLVGLQKRAPKWMQTSGLEWLYRLVQEPGRLFKRYIRTNSKFLILFIKEIIKSRIFGSKK